MWWWLLIIVLLGLALVAVAILADFVRPTSKVLKPPEEKSRIDQIREAAFEVVEASLQEHPEQWVPRTVSGTAYWIKNRSIGWAVWLGSGADGLYLLDRDSANNPLRGNETHLIPPRHIQNKIFSAAMKIAREAGEKTEIRRLQRMVKSFAQEQNGGTHDEKAA